MKEYDFIFSLGFACGASQSLRAAGLQFASYPLDWIGTPGLSASVDVVLSDFAHWLDVDALRLIDVCHGPGFGTRCYLNEKTRIGFCHEFPDTKPFSEGYPGVKATYDRRIARFFDRMKESRRILAVYAERPTTPRLTDEELERELNRLRERYPSAELDLVYFFEDEHTHCPEVRACRNGLTVVAADYRKMEDGVPTQFVEIPVLARWFRDNLSVPPASQSSDKTRVTAEMKTVHSLRWGPDKSRFRRWLNQRAYKAYRHLERLLRRRGLIHSEPPLYFWGQE